MTVENESLETSGFVIEEITQGFALLNKAVDKLDPRLTLKVLRNLPKLRYRLSADVLRQVADTIYLPSESKEVLKYLPKNENLMDTDDDYDNNNNNNNNLENFNNQDESEGLLLPEIDIYYHLILLIFLIDSKNLDTALEFSKVFINKLSSYNRRSMDFLSSKSWFYISRIAELKNKLPDVRLALLSAFRTATLRHDIETQAQLFTLLLRNYLMCKLLVQADNLVLKATFPESAGTNLTARYLYYLGKIRAIQLDYTSAHDHLIGAIRKAPQSFHGTGFLQAANKLNIVIELLMGDIPDIEVFQQPILKKVLIPYFAVTQAVRLGDLNEFANAILKYKNVFIKDETYTLILRLRQNVIRTGIRSMSLTYSRISLRDICMRLNLESEESAEYIVAKAIRDGVIEATINHDDGYMQSNEVLDLYSTQEPLLSFHERIKFCNLLHDESVKAMRYPEDHHRQALKSAEEAREREQELAKLIEEGDDDDDAFDMI